MGVGGGAVASGGDHAVFAAGAVLLVATVLGFAEWQARSRRRRTGSPRSLTGGTSARGSAVTGASLGVGTVALLWGTGLPPATVGLADLSVRWASLGLGVGLVLWGLTDVLEVALDRRGPGTAPGASLQSGPAPRGPHQWLGYLGGVAPTVAVGEEVLFRGALVGGPAAAWSVPAVGLIALSAGAFALYHRWRGRLGAVIAAVVGVGLAVGFVVTGALLVPVVAHYVVDVGRAMEERGVLAPLVDRLDVG